MMSTSFNHRMEMETGAGRRFLKQLAAMLELVFFCWICAVLKSVFYFHNLI